MFTVTCQWFDYIEQSVSKDFNDCNEAVEYAKDRYADGCYHTMKVIGPIGETVFIAERP